MSDGTDGTQGRGRAALAGRCAAIARGELGEVRVLIGIAVIWTIFQLATTAS